MERRFLKTRETHTGWKTKGKKDFIKQEKHIQDLYAFVIRFRMIYSQ